MNESGQAPLPPGAIPASHGCCGSRGAFHGSSLARTCAPPCRCCLAPVPPQLPALRVGAPAGASSSLPPPLCAVCHVPSWPPQTPPTPLLLSPLSFSCPPPSASLVPSPHPICLQAFPLGPALIGTLGGSALTFPGRPDGPHQGALSPRSAASRPCRGHSHHTG